MFWIAEGAVHFESVELHVVVERAAVLDESRFTAVRVIWYKPWAALSAKRAMFRFEFCRSDREKGSFIVSVVRQPRAPIKLV